MPAPDELKACCSDAYASGAVRWLLGDSLHPGGAALTSRLGRELGLAQGDLLLDVASGLGASALRLGAETGCDVVGVDLSPENVEAARRAAAAAGLSGRVRFLVGDAEALPLADGAVDGALCECAFCLFPGKPQAAVELARVLRPGGRLALADVTADPRRLPSQLRTLSAWIACLGGAQPLEELARLLEEAGLEVERRERRDEALVELLQRIESRLRVLASLTAEAAELREQLDCGLGLVGEARGALAEGSLGYGVVIARRPASRTGRRGRRRESSLSVAPP